MWLLLTAARAAEPLPPPDAQRPPYGGDSPVPWSADAAAGAAIHTSGALAAQGHVRGWLYETLALGVGVRVGGADALVDGSGRGTDVSPFVSGSARLFNYHHKAAVGLTLRGFLPRGLALGLEADIRLRDRQALEVAFLLADSPVIEASWSVWSF